MLKTPKKQFFRFTGTLRTVSHLRHSMTAPKVVYGEYVEREKVKQNSPKQLQTPFKAS